jgi:hypothetical protein
LEEVFRGLPTTASNSAIRAARRSIVAACYISSASFSASLRASRGVRGLHTLTDIPAPRATHLDQAREQLLAHWHQTLKSRILLGNYLLPGDLGAQIVVFIEHYNHARYHEGLGNLTPADAYFDQSPASCANGRTSNARPSNIGACNIERSPPKNGAVSPLNRDPNCLKTSDDVHPASKWI